ncbi:MULTISPECIES: thiamine pyrophosphate-binding protein [Streptomyces]|uniref:thiamine pyrophosphate-binding protein n=1 Tax=Streptomyces TaxID=1883 RepID=UPI000A8DE35F|nr:MULTISPECIES: thiamine pyrophosphate-binding protein [Streptomyces]
MGNVSEVVAARLREFGVHRVYGVPGTAVDPLVGALCGGPDAPEFVQARGAESAALMACAEAKLTGRPGCCLAPPGPGTLRPLIPLSAEVPALPYAECARLAGLPAVRCDRPRYVGSVWADVLAGRGPLLLEFVVDGETPPDWAAAVGTADGSGPAPLRTPLTRFLRVSG